MYAASKNCSKYINSLLVVTMLLTLARAVEVTNFIAVNRMNNRQLETSVYYKGNFDKESTLRKGFRKDLSYLLRIPGTHWCGKGFSADKYTRVGGFSRTDKCCRKHDLFCPFWIGAFETKYGLFNWRMNTLMHCDCDERFRTCLRMVKSRDATLVGKMFFNVVQTKCFILKPKKQCARSYWWRKCENNIIVKQAILKDNIPF